MQIHEDLPKELEEYPVVARSSVNFFLSGEHAVMFGMPALCQPVALHVYAGVRKTKDGGIKLLNRNGRTGLYRPNPNRIKEIEFDDFEPVDAVNAIESLLTKEFPRKNAEICLYLTAPPRCGLGTSGAVGAAISLALHWLFSSKKEREEIYEMLQALENPGRRLSEEVKKKTFERIYRLAWKIDSIFHDYKSSGAAALISLTGSPRGLPVIYQGVEREGLYDESKMKVTGAKPLSAKDEHGEVHYELYDKLDYFAKDIHEIEPTADANAFPMVVSLVYSGREKQTGLATRVVEKTVANLLDSVNRNEVRLAKLKSFSLTDIMSPLGICSQKLIYAIIMFFRGEQWRIEEIMKTTQTIQNVLRDFLGVSTPEIEEICKQAAVHGLAAKLTGGGTGGEVVILGRLEKVTDLDGCLNALKNKGFSIHLDITKWSDRKGSLRTTPAKLVKDEAYYDLLFFDVVNSTGREEQVNKYFDEVLKECSEINGNFLKRIGDAGYISFPTAEDGLEWGKRLISIAEGNGLEVRIGIHSGHENWPKGINVPEQQSASMSIAAQCQKLADPNSIVISENVMNELPSEKKKEFCIYKRLEKGNLVVQTYIWKGNK